VTVATVTKAVSVAAKTHVLMTAQGAFLMIEGGNIMLHGPGKVEFKASMKELTGPVSVATPAIANKIHELKMKGDLEIEYVDAEGNALTEEPMTLHFSGIDAKAVTLDGSGRATVKNEPPGALPCRTTQAKIRGRHEYSIDKTYLVSKFPTDYEEVVL
jgi:type VI secretion system secreted protein VgrG